MERPDQDSSLLSRDIFGDFDDVAPSLRVAIASRLALVAEARGGILHACNAFNALYFDYDPQLRRYNVEVDPDSFIAVPMGGQLPVLPTGAFVRLVRGTRELWGEVAAVLGAGEGVERDGWTMGARSGAPASAGTDLQRIIVDTDVFGPLSTEESVERGRWLRPGGGLQDGHLVGPVPADLKDVSARDQTGSFAAYLAGAGRALLELGPLPAWLAQESGEVTEADVAWAVRAAVSCLGRIMETAAGLRTWGLYGRSAASASEFAASETARELRHAVSRPAPGGGPRYSAVWPLLNTLSNGKPEHRAQRSGIAGAALVIDANLALADAASGAPRPPGVDLRVDDRWQQGGIWRAQAQPVDALLAALDPLTPAGIGFAESRASHHFGPDACADGGGRVTVVHVDDELVVVTVALSATDLREGRLELSRPVLELLPSGDLVLGLHHEGVLLSQELESQRVRPIGSAVRGVVWPPGLTPGLKLTVAAARAGRRLTATSVRLPQAVEIPGFGTMHWDYDEALFASGTGLTGGSHTPDGWEPWLPSAARGAWRPAVAALEHLIVESLKRDGDAGPADSRRLDGRRLTAALFGPDVRSPALLWTVIHTCEDMAVLGLLTRAPGERGGPDVFTWWPSTPDAQQARAAEGWEARERGVSLSRHWVRPQHRRLPRGQQPSPGSRRDYAQWRLEVEGADADTELPPGTTFVHGHLRGQEPGKPWHRHVPHQ
ncbi:hypothetical protein [Streptomyces sp. NPDC005525]|uniref:hypothetical protein n=1 Tax=Streptomyces sp. NPDC005525 TaxID=3364720 RepID=UPI0036740362